MTMMEERRDDSDENDVQEQDDAWGLATDSQAIKISQRPDNQEHPDNEEQTDIEEQQTKKITHTKKNTERKTQECVSSYRHPDMTKFTVMLLFLLHVVMGEKIENCEKERERWGNKNRRKVAS